MTGPYLLHIAVEKHPHVCPVLVNQHQARLHGRQDETPLQLEVLATFLHGHLLRAQPQGQLLLVRQLLRLVHLAGLRYARIQSLPVGRGRAPRRLPASPAERVELRIIVHLRCLRRRRRLKRGQVRHVLRIKVDGRDGTEPAQRLLHRRRQDLPDGLLVLELYLRLCRVYVHIDIRRVHLEIHEVRHLLALGNQVLVSIHHSLVEIRVPHVPPVDEEVLVRPFLAGRLGLGHEAAYLDQRRVHLQCEQLGVHLLAEHRHHPLAQRHDRQVEQLCIVVIEVESHVRMHQRDAFELGQYVTEFRRVSLQELPPRRHVEKEVLHQEVTPLRTRDRLLALHLRTGQQQTGAQLVVGPARLQLHLGHGGNRSQRLAAEAHRV